MPANNANNRGVRYDWELISHLEADHVLLFEEISAKRQIKYNVIVPTICENKK